MINCEADFPGVLPSLEAAVGRVDREVADLNDWDVLTAYEALIQVYRAAGRQREARLRPMSPLAQAVFAGVQEVCERWLGRGSELTGGSSEPISLETLLACLKVLRTSARRRSQAGGRRGYLDSIAPVL